jgi:hypothetical protein
MNDESFSEWLEMQGWKGDSKLFANFVNYIGKDGVILAIKIQKVNQRIIYTYNLDDLCKDKPSEIFPTLSNIVNDNAEFVKNSGYSMEYDIGYSWISLNTKSGMDDEQIFFQGEQADNILEEANELYIATGDTLFDDCILHVVKPWVENMI